MTKHANLLHKQAESDALFASIGDGAICTDEKGNINRVNHAALRILGFTESELIGKKLSSAIIATDDNDIKIEAANRPVVIALQTVKPLSQKMYYITKSKSKVPVAVTVSPIIHNGKPIGAIEVFRDITREHEIDRMKSEFISIASHQLRTPLSAVQTYAHLLASGFRGALTKDQHEFMDIILSSVDRMNDIITTLLNVSRIETGKLSIENHNVNLNTLCRTMVEQLQEVAAEKNVRLTYKSFASDATLKTDQILIAEAFANILSNAIKYTPSLGRVEVSLKRNTKNDLIFCVKDSGLGIPHKLQDQVFTKFFRGANVVKWDTTGTGLGLYMVKQIADALGGKTWFKSQEGKGTNFYFGLSDPSE